jgi:hypothetical protein
MVSEGVSVIAMTNCLRTIVPAVAFVALAAFGPAAAQEAKKAQPAPKQPSTQAQTVKQSETQVGKLTKKDLPSAVLSAFEKNYPKATIKAAKKEVKDSVTFWDIGSMEGAIERDVLYSPDGKIVRVREDIAAASLPAEATANIAKTYPNATIEKAEKILRGNKVEYRVWISEPGKDKTELVLDGAGRLVTSEKAGQ